MSWFEKILDAVQAAAVIGERVERLGGSVADMASEMRSMDRRIARLEGAFAATGVRQEPPLEPGFLPSPPRDESS